MQRSDQELDVRDLFKTTDGSSHCSLSCARTPNLKQDRRILDWWWVSPHMLLLVTTTSVELYSMAADEMAAADHRPTAVEKVEASWCRFDPVAQVVLVATGKMCSFLRIFKVNSGQTAPRARGGSSAKGLQRLPHIEIDMRSTGRGRQPLLRSEVLVAPLYNLLYVIRIDKFERKLVLNAIGAAARPLEIKLFSQSDHLDVTVVDNVLILHDTGTKQSVMYDIKLSVDFPVIPPFGLLAPLATLERPQLCDLYATSWVFEQPYFVTDQSMSQVYHVRPALNNIGCG